MGIDRLPEPAGSCKNIYRIYFIPVNDIPSHHRPRWKIRAARVLRFLKCPRHSPRMDENGGEHEIFSIKYYSDYYIVARLCSHVVYLRGCGNAAVCQAGTNAPCSGPAAGHRGTKGENGIFQSRIASRLDHALSGKQQTRWYIGSVCG